MNYCNTTCHRATAWAKRIALLVPVGFAMELMAADTTFNGTGLWTDSTKWSNGLPGSGDRAYIKHGASATIDGQTVNVAHIIPGNNTTLTINNSAVTMSGAFNLVADTGLTNTVVVTDSAITQHEAYVGKPGSKLSYTQRGGSFVSTRLWDIYGQGLFNMAFDGVATDFQSYRLCVGRGTGGTTLSFANGTFASTADILMCIGANALGRMDFKDETINLAAYRWHVGYSNGSAAEPATVTMEDCVLNQNSLQINVGIGNGGASKGLFVATDCAWTNSSGKAIYVGGGTENSGSYGHVILSNCSFKTAVATSGSHNFILGQLRGTTGRLDIVGGTFDSATEGGMDTANVFVGYVPGATGILAVHGRTLTSLPPHASSEGSDSTLELVDCNYAHADHLTLGSKKNGMQRYHVFGGTFNVGSAYNLVVGRNNTTDGGTAGCEAIIDDATVTCNLFVAGRNSNHPGVIILRNGAVANCGGLYAGYQGTSVGAVTNLGATVNTSQVYVGTAPGSTGFYRDGDGAVTTTSDFRAPHQGTGFAEIGGKVTADRFFMGVNNSYTGTVTVVEGADITAKNEFYVGVRDRPGVATLELKGGTVLAPYLRHFNGGAALIDTAKSHVYFNGGTLKAKSDQSSNWIAPDFTTTAVSDGGAVFDSNGHTVASAAPLTHDSRATAALKDGGIVKKGSGTVKLTGSLSFNGDIRVETGTLDLSRATYAMGAAAGLSGSGTLMAPAGGLTCGGRVLLDASRGTLTVDGDLTLGGTATVEVENPETLDRERSYTILTATSLSGTPTAANLPEGWRVSKRGSSIKLSYDSATVFLVK